MIGSDAGPFTAAISFSSSTTVTLWRHDGWLALCLDITDNKKHTMSALVQKNFRGTVWKIEKCLFQKQKEKPPNLARYSSYYHVQFECKMWCTKPSLKSSAANSHAPMERRNLVQYVTRIHTSKSTVLEIEGEGPGQAATLLTVQ